MLRWSAPNKGSSVDSRGSFLPAPTRRPGPGLGSSHHPPRPPFPPFARLGEDRLRRRLSYPTTKSRPASGPALPFSRGRGMTNSQPRAEAEQTDRCHRVIATRRPVPAPRAESLSGSEPIGARLATPSKGCALRVREMASNLPAAVPLLASRETRNPRRRRPRAAPGWPGSVCFRGQISTDVRGLFAPPPILRRAIFGR